MPAEKKNIRISSIHEIRYSIYADIESLIRKIDRRANNPEKILNNENRQAYSMSIFNVYNLGI